MFSNPFWEDDFVDPAMSQLWEFFTKHLLHEVRRKSLQDGDADSGGLGMSVRVHECWEVVQESKRESACVSTSVGCKENELGEIWSCKLSVKIWEQRDGDHTVHVTLK